MDEQYKRMVQFIRDVGADAVGRDQFGVDGLDEIPDQLVEVGDLGRQLLVAAGQGPQCEPGGGGRGCRVGAVGAPTGAGGDQILDGQGA